MSGRTVLVTGGAGFVGARLVTRLLERGAQVVALVRPRTDLSRVPPGARCVVHNGSTSALIDIVRLVRPDVAYHLAARFVAEHGSDDITDLVVDNVLLSAQLFEALAAANCHKLVMAGTGWQHSAGAPAVPVNLYAATKQAAEDVLSFFADSSPLRAITVKFFDTYGPNDRRPKLFSALRRAHEDGAPLKMSPGEQLIDLVHIEDIVAALLVAGNRVADPLAKHESFLASADTRYTLRQVVDLYAQVTGRRVEVIWGARPYRGREVMVPWIGDRLPGWRPAIPLPEGLRTLVADG